MNKRGIFSWFGYVMPFEKRIKLIKEAGFDCISIWWEDELEYRKESFCRIAENYGLEIENLHYPFMDCNNLWSFDKEIREETLKGVLSIIDDCSSFRIPLMVMHPVESNGLIEINPNGLESFYHIVKRAEERGIILCLENTMSYSHLRYLFNNIKSNNLGFCYDSSHDNISGNEFGLILKENIERLKTMHISDNFGIYDDHLIPKEGKINFKVILKILREYDYRGCLGMEVFPGNNKTIKPYDFLIKAYKSLNIIEL